MSDENTVAETEVVPAVEVEATPTTEETTA